MVTVSPRAGNLLNSLMGSGEDDDGAEEAQEDSSPIELDWACSLGEEQDNTKKEEEHRPIYRLPSSPWQQGWGGAWVCVFRGVLFPGNPPPLPPSSHLSSPQNQNKNQFTKTSPSALPGLTAPNCKLFPSCSDCIIFILIIILLVWDFCSAFRVNDF